MNRIVGSEAMRLDDLGLQYGTDKASSGHGLLHHYEQFFSHFRNDAFTLIEIGGLTGASLRMWRDFFPNAEIVCVDVSPTVKAHEGDRISVEIGDAGSKPFLKEIRKKHRSARIVLDDGSHRWDHQRTSLKELFPIVEPGGYYVVEDTHTSYEPGFAGEDDVPLTRFLYTLVDYLHLRGENRTRFEQFYNKGLVAVAREIESVCFIRRACVIRKRTARKG